MARSTGGPRQPLSQRKPKTAAGRGGPIAKAAGRAKDAVTGLVKSVTKSAGKRGARPAPEQAIPGSRAPTGRGRGSVPATRARARRADPAVVYDRLAAQYPDAHCELDFQNAFQLLVATILSAQCTDKRVNLTTPALFAAYPTPEALAAARHEDVEVLVKSTGFFRAKAKSVIGMANALVERHGGEVPRDMAALTKLPGVGRKTANVILGNAFATNEGVVVDTHVARLSDRLGFSHAGDPVKIEQDLVQLFPREQWTMLSHLLIWHGRRVCEARKPRCEQCVLNDICPSAFVAGGRDAKR